MNKPLSGHKIAILVANGFDEVDMTHAQRALASLGATLKIVSTENGLVNSWVGTGWGHHFPTDANVAATLAADYDGLYVPGGKRSIDKLKESAHVRRILRGFFDAGKPMALLGLGVELLISCDRAKECVVSGDATSEAAMVAAGAVWSAETPCVQSFLATSAGGAADNTLFAMFGEFYAQQPETFQQAA